MMRLAVLTTGRQDWGILRSTCALLRDDPRFDLRMLVGGMHCAEPFGRTEQLIRDDGFEPSERLDWIADGVSQSGQAGRALEAVSEALQRQRPDALVMVGDRFETAAAALAATLERVPIVHLHGGEETAGAFDDLLRNAVTKLSHLHLVSHLDYARRVIAMGEAPGTVRVVGAPGLDNLHRADLPGRAELERSLGIELTPPVVIVTLHPTTLALPFEGEASSNGPEGPASAVDEVACVIGAMDRVAATYVVTLPNNDPGHELLREALVAAAHSERRVAVAALGDRRFWGLMRIADAMLGNSSSALIEAPALGLPAVNLGDRQNGRIRGANVIDVPTAGVPAVANALREALAPATRRRLAGAVSPFGDGRSAPRIIEILAGWTPPHPPRKAPVAIEQVML
jgi:UDP-hydrolysing UDP-N-acetyl-D-glucosamine 2-epimerase